MGKHRLLIEKVVCSSLTTKYSSNFLPRIYNIHIVMSPTYNNVSQLYHCDMTLAQCFHSTFVKYSQIQHRHNLVLQPTNNVGLTVNQYSLVCVKY